MQFKKQLSMLAFAAVFGVSAPAVVHAQSEGAGGYFGGSIGQGDPDNNLDSDTAFQIYGGYMFNQNLGLEGGYAKYGDFEGGATTMDVDGFYLAGVGRYPINDQFSVVGKAGLVHYGFDTNGPGGRTSGDGSSAMLGIGVDYNVNESVSVGAEYDLIDGVEDTDVSAIWLNVTVKTDSF